MNDNGRNYRIETRFDNGTTLTAKITNAAGPVSALMMFINENEDVKINSIENIQIIDIENNKIFDHSATVSILH